MPLVDLVMGRGGGRCPRWATGSATRTLTRRPRRPCRAIDARATRAPRPARPRRPHPGVTGRPLAERRDLERAHRPEDLLDRDRAEVAEPEDLAGQLALAAGQDEAAPLELAC